MNRQEALFAVTKLVNEFNAMVKRVAELEKRSDPAEAVATLQSELTKRDGEIADLQRQIRGLREELKEATERNARPAAPPAQRNEPKTQGASRGTAKREGAPASAGSAGSGVKSVGETAEEGD